MICPKCKKVIPDDSVFCPECGEKIPEQNQNKGIYCPECGAGNAADARFCEKCGSLLIQSELQKEESGEMQGWQEESKTQQQGKGLLIAGILILFVALGTGGAFAAYHFMGQSEVGSDSGEEENPVKGNASEDTETNEDIKTNKDTKSDSTTKANSDETEEYDSKEGGIHRYEYVISDCTWEQAYSECLKKGGYLVRINSREEYNYILNEITRKQMDRIHFRIGAKRNTNGRDYYWINEENQLYGDKVNSPAYWCSTEWMTGEPSFEDGGTMEMYLDIFYYQGMSQWVWNDVPNDIVAVVPSYAGKLGYICEYEDE